MKRRFVECAILLGIVMSVMFLAQTQDVIGHNKVDPNTGNPHKPPGHTHNPSTNVDSKGNPVTTGGEDPRGNHYSGDCRNGRVPNPRENIHDDSAWGFRYWGGKYSPSPGDLDNATQNVFAVRVDVHASTSAREASVTVTPGIDQLRQFPYLIGNWQGAGGGTVSFSGVCYHLPRYIFGSYIECIDVSRSGDSWTGSGFLDLEVKNKKISKGKDKTYGRGFESHGASLTANSKHSYTSSYDQLHARGYVFRIELNASWFDTLLGWDSAPKQDKDASGQGQLLNNRIISNTAKAQYRWDDDHECPNSDSSYYDYGT